MSFQENTGNLRVPSPSKPCAQGINEDERDCLLGRPKVATAASSNSERVVGADGFEPPTSCSQSIDEGAELPSFWDALTGETVRDRERWLPRWLPQTTQLVKRLIPNQQVRGSIPLVGSMSSVKSSSFALNFSVQASRMSASRTQRGLAAGR